MSRHMRFLFATAEGHPTFRPDVRVLFGKYLPQCGIETDLVTITERGHEGPSVPPWGGGRVEVREAHGTLRRMLATIRLDASLIGRARRGGYDGIIARDKPILGLLSLLAARLAGIPFVYWMSFPMPESYLWLSRRKEGGQSFKRRLYFRLRGLLGRFVLHRILVPAADHLFVQSTVMERELRAGGSLRHDRVTPVPMGVDVEGLPEPAPAALPLLAGRRVAVYLGTLDRVRRPEIMVDAALKVGRLMPDFLLLVIGDAEEPGDRGWLKRYAESVDAGDFVHFTGKIPFDQALALARCARVGLSPFPRNALLESASPTKAVEYLALGLPVVCNDQPDQAYVVGESGGGLSVPLDADGFAAGIVECLSDPARSARMGERGRAWIGRHRSYRALAEMVAGRLRSLAKAGAVASRELERGQ